MAARSRPISNVLAGGFLLVGVVLAIVISFVLSGVGERFKPSNAYTVRFRVTDGASGIKPGSDVLLGGQAIGKVRSIEFVSSNGVITDIDVKVRIGAGLSLYDDAMVYLERPLLGSLSTINIASLGNLQPGKSVALPPGSTIRARLAPPSFLAQAGFGSDEAQRVQRIIQLAEKAVERAVDIVDRNAAKIDRTFDDAAQVVHDVRGKVPEWSGSIDRTLAELESASVKTGPLLDSAQARVTEARGILEQTRAIVDENRPLVLRLITDAQEAAEKFNRDSVDRLNRALLDAEEAFSAFSKVAGDAGALINEETPNIQKTLANARLASDQLKLAAVEIRSQPWRLLYTPSLKETETSVLYDSARAYAYAVSDLRAASEALEAALGSPAGAADPSAIDRDAIQGLLNHLKTAFDSYKTAERDLLDRLIKRGGTSAMPRPDSSRGASRVDENK